METAMIFLMTLNLQRVLHLSSPLAVDVPVTLASMILVWLGLRPRSERHTPAADRRPMPGRLREPALQLTESRRNP